MLAVIGYEGHRQPDALTSWGGAAITINDELRNALTGLSRKYDELEVMRLVETGALTKFPTPLKIPDDFASASLVVLEISRSSVNAELLRLDPGKLGGLVASRPRGEYHAYVFKSLEAFEHAARGIVHSLLHVVLYEDMPSQRKRDLLNAGFVVAPHHPGLNAVRVALAEDRDLERIIAEANLRAKPDKELFELFLDGLLSEKSDYLVKYIGGIAAGGGMNVDSATTILGAVNSAHEHLGNQIEHEHPFLNKAEPSRLHQLKAASAEFTFRAAVESETLGARLARFLELRLLEDSLNGKVPEDLAQTRDFRTAIETICAPDSNTQVTHKGIHSETFDDVTVDFGDDRTLPSWSEPMTILGYQSGLVRDAGKLEASIFPGLALSLPTDDNGNGEQPEGLAFLENRDDFLFKPALFTVVRQVAAGKSETYYLRRVERLQAGRNGLVTAIPSSIVRGALVHGLRIPIHWGSAGKLNVGESVVSGITAGVHPAAREWIRHYREICFEIELADLRRGRLAPAKMPKSPILIHVLTALTELKGAAHQRDLVTIINDLCEKPIRINNTRREVIHNPTLLKFAEDDTQVIEITERGERYLRAYRAIARRA